VAGQLLLCEIDSFGETSQDFQQLKKSMIKHLNVKRFLFGFPAAQFVYFDITSRLLIPYGASATSQSIHAYATAKAQQKP
jgi:hypothetical protein